ncbi:MAG TPA: hypothetical protein VK896_00530, partial [Gaiellaceae bacterium]|nr:hypothetical protein [Gaiellaceae bacterium]
VARLRAEGVLLSFASKPGLLRAVTHLDVSEGDIDAAIPAIARALSGREAPVAVGRDAPTPY